MKGLVIYPSTLGAIREVALAVADGIGEWAAVDVTPVWEIRTGDLDSVDLVVIGGPLPLHGGRHVLATASQPCVGHPRFAAFDTRVGRSPAAGRSAARAARDLQSLGCVQLAPPQSFMLDTCSCLRPGECDRARLWGSHLGASLAGPIATTAG